MLMPWRAPTRPRDDNGISQNYCSGVVTVYTVEDTAEPGYRPKEKLTKKITLRYEEQRLGIQRYYSGSQNQVEIERVIRTPSAGRVNNQDVAVTEDGKQYRIEMVQNVLSVYPSSIDITLAKIEQEYDIPESEVGE